MIGGLIFATIATLMFVPVIFSIVHGRKAIPDDEPAARDPEPGVGAPSGEIYA